MEEETLVFVNNKESGEFHKYEILKKSKPEAELMVEKFNKSDEKMVAKIIEDKDVLAAILQRETSASIKSYCKDVMDSIEDISEQISCLESEVSSFMHKIKERLESSLKMEEEA